VFADPHLCELFDIRLFIDADPDLRLLRRLNRDITERGRSVPAVLAQYEMTVRPMHLLYVEPSKAHAHLILPHGGHNRIGINIVATKIKELIQLDNKGNNSSSEKPTST